MFEVQINSYGGETITLNRFEFGLVVCAWNDCMQRDPRPCEAAVLLDDRFKRHWDSAYPTRPSAVDAAR